MIECLTKSSISIAIHGHLESTGRLSDIWSMLTRYAVTVIVTNTNTDIETETKQSNGFNSMQHGSATVSTVQISRNVFFLVFAQTGGLIVTPIY